MSKRPIEEEEELVCIDPYTEGYREGYVKGYDEGITDGRYQGYKDAKFRAYRAMGYDADAKEELEKALGEE